MEKRAYTKNQSREIGFERGEYSAPQKAGSFIGTLEMKVYGDRCIYFYFITVDSEKIRLPLWYDPRNNNSFHPKKCDTDFSYVSLGSKWEITVGLNTKDRLTWVNAVEVK